MLCVLIVEGMSVVVNVMLSLKSVMSPPHALCNLSVRTDVKLCIFCVLALGPAVVRKDVRHAQFAHSFENRSIKCS